MVHQNQIPDDAKEQACVAVVNWRAADKVAIANKKDVLAQRDEYKERNNLRRAADKLTEAHHG